VYRSGATLLIETGAGGQVVTSAYLHRKEALSSSLKFTTERKGTFIAAISSHPDIPLCYTM
jgi:hypothetical protein